MGFHLCRGHNTSSYCQLAPSATPGVFVGLCFLMDGSTPGSPSEECHPPSVGTEQLLRNDSGHDNAKLHHKHHWKVDNAILLEKIAVSPRPCQNDWLNESLPSSWQQPRNSRESPTLCVQKYATQLASQFLVVAPCGKFKQWDFQFFGPLSAISAQSWR